MQNVLIDDRRIWVDFSQSVAKLRGAWNKQRAKRAVQPPPIHDSDSLVFDLEGDSKERRRYYRRRHDERSRDREDRYRARREDRYAERPHRRAD